MNRRSKFRLAGRIGLLLSLLLPAMLPGQNADVGEQLWHFRNLGKAYYENSATQYEAVGEFKKALELAPDSTRERVNYGLAMLRAGEEDAGVVELEKAQKQDPSIPHTWFNLGIAYKRKSDYERAVKQLEGMVALVSDEPITHYNLGVLYKLAGETEKSLLHFELAAKLEPSLAGPHFQLATGYRIAKRLDDSKREMDLFREIKKQQAGAPMQEDLEWSFYSEIYDIVDTESAVEEGLGAELKFERQEIAAEFGEGGGLSALDFDGDRRPDLAAWSTKGIRLFGNGITAAGSTGLEGVGKTVHVAAGDFDNDAFTDLCVLTEAKALLFRNAGGKFEAHAAPLPDRGFERAVWLDYDHDYDLDLFLLGEDAALFRNNGEAGFSDQTADFPFVDGHALDATQIDLVADAQGMDLIVSYAEQPGVLYRDLLAGKYEAMPLAELPAGVSVAAFDINQDGWSDFAAAGVNGVTLFLNDEHRGFKLAPGPDSARGPIAFADLENRSVSDLVTAGGVHRNLGRGGLAAEATSQGVDPAAAVAVADFDVDGRLDLAKLNAEGDLEVLFNRTETPHGWLSIGLDGVKNLKLAPGSEIEVKAGARYQKKIYEGFPLLFGLNNYKRVDTVRITWPNGMIQNEPLQKAGEAPVYKEAQRLSGSCPMIFTWNGDEFEYITDVLGVAPLGASAGDGTYFPVDHDEFIQIRGESLKAVDGLYEIRVTEELREVCYLDEIRLVALDHPSELDIFTNDKFKAPPFPEFRLFGVDERIRPVSARDHKGADVREQLLALDQRYPDGFKRDYAGVAEKHFLELDFGKTAPGAEAILVLSGWVDWADGSTFIGAAQESDEGLIFPSLEVKDSDGNWQTAIADMGIPAGKPKTIVVDLSGKFLTDSRDVRIVTNLCVYWDEIFLSTKTEAPPARLTNLHPVSADIRFRGFSKVVVHPERKQPEYFVYGEVRPYSMWNPTPGLYTRFGDVRPLLKEIDDRLVIMGSGDELRLHFDARQLPELKTGWKREFLLFVDGWAKDGDANTAYSQTVEPLPFHAMPYYPYGDTGLSFPKGGHHDRYREFYNRRPALRLIRPLTEGLRYTL